MKLLVSTRVSTFRHVTGGASQVHLCEHVSNLASFLHGDGIGGIDVWICEGNEVSEELLRLWLRQDQSSPRTLLARDPAHIPRLQQLAGGRVDIHATPPRQTREQAWTISTLQAAEKLHAQSWTRRTADQKKANPGAAHQETVLLVGAGIVNLLTAELLASKGYTVRVVDAGPDPRACDDWTRLGVTHGGGNARMFTFTEADSYNEQGSAIYQDMRYVCRNTTLEGGWAVKPPADLSGAERAWVDTFERLPTWLAQAMKRDVYHVNREAGVLWSDLMRRVPHVFEGVSLHPNILRLYAEEDALTAARKLNLDLGTVVDDQLPLHELLRETPNFAKAAKSHELAGALIVQGFTLAIRSLVNKLIDHIVHLGGDFSWNCSAQRMRRNTSGEVTSLDSEQGSLKADHYVISTGVTRNGLLDGTASQDLIQGVLGVWLQIPNLEPMQRKSIKIHRRGCLVEDINVTVLKDDHAGEDILLLGGGYGYVGLDHPDPEAPEMRALFDELEEVARIYFPAGYRSAKERGTLWPAGEKKFCSRPFTCTGLGVFEDVPAEGGGRLVVTGGNNTGGFAQSPAIARAVHRAFIGEHDPVHELFHPRRSQFVT